MSPTTFNLYMQSLVKNGLVKKTNERHKSVLYELNEAKGWQWAFNELALSIADFMFLVPIDVDHDLIPEDFTGDTVGAVLTLLKHMNDDDLNRIKNCAEYIAETIDHYQQAEKEVKTWKWSVLNTVFQVSPKCGVKARALDIIEVITEKRGLLNGIKLTLLCLVVIKS